ncbi:MAG: type IX secretion system sortase PorU [Bacteroidales bacterium]|nr:type IX secretion system sortase PorU [Bacteroidales bacterium]
MKLLSLLIILLSISINAMPQAEHSVLASGKWVKVRIKDSGIKMLTRSALSSMGFADMDKVAVYGNGGKELPLENSASRIDDLAKLPVFRTDNAILFYAQGITSWEYNETNDIYEFSENEQDSYSYYYITDSTTPSVEPEKVDYSSKVATTTIDTYDDRAYHALHNYSYLLSGRDFYGEQFTTANNSISIPFSLDERVSQDTKVRIAVNMMARSLSKTYYSILFNNDTLGTYSISPIVWTSTGAQAITNRTNITSTAGQKNEYNLKINATVNTDGTTVVYLDYAMITVCAPLNMNSRNELLFRNSTTINYNSSCIIDYAIKGTSGNTIVLNIDEPTNPKVVATTSDGTTLHAKYYGGNTINEFISFKQNGSFEEPTFVESVSNQDLHATNAVDYLIIYHPAFQSEAERLASLHADYSGLNCAAVNVDAIYNEFSSGKREATAIRDYVRLVYNKGQKSGNTLKYVLLFGNGSYDNLNYGDKYPDNRIPTHQSEESLIRINSYTTDDFFGWMESGEGSASSEAISTVDIGIGRFPVSSETEAASMVDKVESYLTSLENSNWKLRAAFTCDDGDSNEHLIFSEQKAKWVADKYPILNETKIYQEAYTATTTTSGLRYYQAIEDLQSIFENGALFIDYTGHGSETAWATRALLNLSDYVQWNNRGKYPFVISAACHTGSFDRGITSLSKYMVLPSNCGAIGSLAANRITYSNYNYKISRAFLGRVLDTDSNGKRYTVGDAVKYAKQKTIGNINSLKYVLIGDPAITLAYDENYTISTDSINDIAFDVCDDPLKILSVNKISGSIRDQQGNILDDFNGQINITIYNKKDSISTKGAISEVYTFENYNSVLYNGLSTVENGLFNTTIVLPKDSYSDEGYGRISYYAVSNNNVEARGYTNTLLLGGIDTEAANDTIGPEITAWVEYLGFDDGSTTGATPTLHASLSDNSGINISGIGIGHDITIVLNDDRNNPYNLNSYFIYSPNSYTSGSLDYTLPELENMKNYTLTLKAWDNANNSSEKTIEFFVDKNSNIQFGTTEIYPCPYISGSSDLNLFFTHNGSSSRLTLKMAIYSISGRLMTQKTITTTTTQGQSDLINLISEMPNTATLGKGIYIIDINITDETGRSGSFKRKILFK